LLSAIFKPGETTVDMSALSTRIISNPKPFDEPLEQEMISRGWLDLDRKRQRRNLGVTGFLLLLGSLGMFLIGMLGTGAELVSDVNQTAFWAAVVGIAAGAFVLSIGLMIYATTFSPLTPEGEAEAARWQAFEKYLKQASKGQQPYLSAEAFERYLPWAAAFGLGSAWAKHFQQVGGAPLPLWFRAMSDSSGDFSAMVAVMAASDSAAASMSGGGSSASGGGGASGAG
jgi:uncharacterized membrane protein